MGISTSLFSLESFTLNNGNKLTFESILPDWLAEVFTPTSLSEHFNSYSNQLPSYDYHANLWYYNNEMLFVVTIQDYRAENVIRPDSGIITSPYTDIISMLAGWSEDVVEKSGSSSAAYKVPGIDLSFTVEFMKDSGENLYIYHAPNIWSHRSEYHFPYVGYENSDGVHSVQVVSMNEDATIWYFSPPEDPSIGNAADSKYVFDFFE